MMQQPSAAIWFVIDLVFHAVVLGALAFGIYRKSRVAAVVAIAFVAGTQLYVWLGLRSFSGTIVSILVVGFLLRGTTRIFQFHRERRESQG
jgi:ABC-type anion transport system duplicated permease subunit